MYRPVHAWVKVPLQNKVTTTAASAASPALTKNKSSGGPAQHSVFTNSSDEQKEQFYHNTLCLEYPANLLNGKFTPSNPDCNISSDTAVTGPKSLIMLIPGNPGMCQFYDKFVQELCRTIPSLAVVVPSLGGFSLPTKEHHHSDKDRGHSPQRNSIGGGRNSTRRVYFNDDDTSSPLQQEEESSSSSKQQQQEDDSKVFLLQDQLDFLYSFVDSFIIPVVEQYNVPYERTWVAGHSIGGFFSLHVLDHFRQKALQRQRIIGGSSSSNNNKKQQQQQNPYLSPVGNQYLAKRNAEVEGVFYRAVLLAPTIAHMAESNNAKAMYNVIHHGKHFLPTLVSGVLTKLLPKKLLDTLVDMALAKELDAADVETAQKIVHHPKITRQILKLASDELTRVNPLDEVLLKRIQEHIIFYFVQSDDWVPSRVHDELRNVEKFGSGKWAGFFVGEDPEVKHAWCSRAYSKVAHFVTHAFGSETGVQVSMSSPEAAQAGFVLLSSRSAFASPNTNNNANSNNNTASRRRQREQ